MSADFCEHKKGDFAKVEKRKLWEMEGLERNVRSKVKTDSKE